MLLPALVLLGCAGHAPAPIEERGARGSSAGPRSYRVVRGDTMYSIAFRYGLDYRRLAAANGVAAPYTIYPGQTLSLAEAAVPSPTTKAGTKAPPVAPPPPAPRRESAQAAAAGTGSTTARPAQAAGNAPVSRWSWPGSGRVTRGFDASRHKGIDLAGERGAPVRAAAAGRVVYAGSGIAGYGLLLIIRHNDEYLSAYGHNDVLLVAEGDRVTAAQVVSRMGSSGTDTVKLHFELRRHGRPVDPLRLLPSR
jgi:lipoprotein NlpD